VGKPGTFEILLFYLTCFLFPLYLLALSPNYYSVRITAALFLVIFLFSCKKESFTTSADAFLSAETDTLHFDTVFTSTGSVTQRFKIFNENSKGIHISTIQLKGGISSPFKINAMGVPGPVISSIDVADNDSLYVFVSVSINPTAANLPFVVRDSIEVWSNGNKKVIHLEAYGRNAHFFRSKIITGDETWNNDLPYVILGALEIKENAKLTINEGCQIYLHADAPVIVNGTLNVSGKKFDSTKVVFTGDRLDEPFSDYPASWPGIYFNPSSKNNIINYAVIKNAYQAVVVQNPSLNANPKLTIAETIIDNAYDVGLLGINTKIAGQNLLISNCDKNLVLVNGGNYQFTHCTVASYSNGFMVHEEPVLLLSDYLESSQNHLDVLFRNCIFWGEEGIVETEIRIEKKGSPSIKFDNVIWKVKENPVTPTGNSFNQDPLFDSINVERNFYDFHLQESSKGINNGGNTSITLDLDGKPRPVGLPDLGCYERN